jgi:hypothetical protein
MVLATARCFGACVICMNVLNRNPLQGRFPVDVMTSIMTVSITRNDVMHRTPEKQVK